MKAADAKGPLPAHLRAGPATDKWYHYVRIIPKSAADRADFTEARLVLSASTFLPRQLWFQQPNGNEVTWDFPKVDNGANPGHRFWSTRSTPWLAVHACSP